MLTRLLIIYSSCGADFLNALKCAPFKITTSLKIITSANAREPPTSTSERKCAPTTILHIATVTVYAAGAIQQIALRYVFLNRSKRSGRLTKANDIAAP